MAGTFCYSQVVFELVPSSNGINLKELLFQEDKSSCFGNWVFFSGLWVQLQFLILLVVQILIGYYLRTPA